MMFLSRMIVAQVAGRAHLDVPDASPHLLGVGVDHGGHVDPVLGEDRRRGDRLAQPARTDEDDVVLTLRPQDLADLAEQRIDVVADPSLAEFSERGQVAADLRRVDVRVVRDLLRRDPVLAHLLRLGQNLEVAREPRGHSDREALAPSGQFLCGTL